MAAENLVISPKTKVGELLDTYPQLESVLLDLSPAFARLKNPILRKTVARIATLQQAAVVGGLKTDELVNRLRKEAGQNEMAGDTGGKDTVCPCACDGYVKKQRIQGIFDAKRKYHNYIFWKIDS
jgi:hypothetical protein